MNLSAIRLFLDCFNFLTLSLISKRGLQSLSFFYFCDSNIASIDREFGILAFKSIVLSRIQSFDIA